MDCDSRGRGLVQALTRQVGRNIQDSSSSSSTFGGDTSADGTAGSRSFTNQQILLAFSLLRWGASWGSGQPLETCAWIWPSKRRNQLVPRTEAISLGAIQKEILHSKRRHWVEALCDSAIHVNKSMIIISAPVVRKRRVYFTCDLEKLEVLHQHHS